MGVLQRFYWCAKPAAIMHRNRRTKLLPAEEI